MQAAHAAQAFAGLAGMDPERAQTPQGAARAGECYRMQGTRGELVYSVSFGHGVAWINAAAGQGTGLTAEGLSMIEAQAITRGCRRVGFQTLRRGLVRRARQQGYRITSAVGDGFVMVKDIP